MVNKKINVVLILLVLIFLMSFALKKAPLFNNKNSIVIYPQKEIGVINKKVFGNNLLGYNDKCCANTGAGIWNPEIKTSIGKVVDLAREAGITVARFPGGCGTHHYNWKDAVSKERKHFLYGIDEFIKTCNEIKAEPILTVSYFTGNEQDAADLIEYLNSPNDGSNPKGGIDWAKKRADNGHPQPYKIKYFEIGNEVYHGDHVKIKKVTPEEYAYRYLQYYEKMKKVDPSIKVGVILYTKEWNEKVLRIIKDKLDFAIVHSYLNGGFGGKEIENTKANIIFERALAEPDLYLRGDFKEELQLLKKQSGKMIPLAVTEYNGGFVQDKPVPYRHCLGTALLNAELIRIFLEPQNRILMANYWNFVNEYWGMIANNFDGTSKTLYNNYYKRPNFYVFELYNKHFGDNLLLTGTTSSYYMFRNKRIPYLSVSASIDQEKNKVYLMVINRNLKDAMTSTIELKDFKPSKTGHFWVLNGPSIDATNEKEHDNVKISYCQFKIDGRNFKFTFEPHSLTAIEIAGIKNEN